MAKRSSKLNLVSREYQAALHNFWAGRPRTAIEHLSKLLADDPEREDQFCLYRLWIEILADLGETKTLSSLNEHLFARSDAAPELRHTYMALRGLILFEKDEIDGAKLFASAVKKYDDDAYCRELNFVLRQRFASAPTHERLIKNVNDTYDYFHLQTDARFLVINNNEKNLKSVIHRVEKLFPMAPLVLNFELHRGFAVGDFKKSLKSAKQLLEKYPGQMDYAIYGAYAAIKGGDNEAATQLLEKAVGLGAEDDIDAAALLGSCYTDLYQNSQDEVFREKASIFLERASTMLEDSGYSAVIPSYHENILADGQNTNGGSEQGEEKMEEPANLWLVKLSQAEFHEVRTKSDEELNYLTRPIGGKAKAGDLVFFTGDDYRNKKVGKDNEKFWRIAAVFSVASEAKWHPFHGYESSLQLISKPSASIPVSIHFLDSSAVMDSSQFDKDDPRKYGVYELDYSALETITNAIQEFNTTEGGSERILDEIERMRMTS